MWRLKRLPKREHNPQERERLLTIRGRDAPMALGTIPRTSARSPRAGLPMPTTRRQKQTYARSRATARPEPRLPSESHAPPAMTGPMRRATPRHQHRRPHRPRAQPRRLVKAMRVQAGETPPAWGTWLRRYVAIPPPIGAVRAPPKTRRPHSPLRRIDVTALVMTLMQAIAMSRGTRWRKIASTSLACASVASASGMPARRRRCERRELWRPAPNPRQAPPAA